MVTRKKRLLLWWGRSGMALRVTVFLALAFLLSLLVYWQRPQEESPYLGRNVLVFILVNLNIVVLCVLAFLIGRNIVKLIFDRRRNILGSKLKLRLVTAFVGLTLIPTIFLFLLASGLLNRAMEGWFSSQVEASVSGAVEVAKYHYASMKESVLSSAESIARELAHGHSLSDKAALESWFEDQRKADRLFGIKLISQSHRVIVEVHNAAAVIPAFSEPDANEEALDKALSQNPSVLFEENEASQFVRAYLPVRMDGKNLVLITTLRVNPDLSQALSGVNDSYKEYEQLKLFKAPLKSGYLLTLAMITGLILFSAIWIGFYIAREMAVPIQRLAEGTRAVARGDYDFQIRERGDDELAFLVKSFNTMTSDLRQSRKDAQQRRLYIETILGNLAVGVIGLDTNGLVTSVNAAAARIFNLSESDAVLGKPISKAIAAEEWEQIRPLLESFMGEHPEARSLEREISVQTAGRESKVLCTAGRMSGPEGEVLGAVLLFDDITELTKAQHMSVWREVARRIAHEIKNPLTPIQLSAQRLQKLLPELNAPPSVHECAETIVENVASIKRLANEFSNFARMPTAELKASDLNVLVSGVIAPFAESHSDIVFQFIPDTKVPEMMMDREQIRRMMINLIDNAIAALVRDPGADSRGGARIVIKTSYDNTAKTVSVEVSDNGPGIPAADKVRVFEPYFTTKSGGSGLGLAIVTSIVSDHQGQIRVFDSKPRGARFVVDIPVSPKASTQRRFATDSGA